MSSITLCFIWIFVFFSVAPFASAQTSSKCSSPAQNDPDYLIIGAGGAGIQLALFLLKSRETSSFQILEKTDVVGSFWKRFPRFEELISINKYVRNETQRYRYDWHSFLGTDMKMFDVTNDYFPRRSDWQKYMAETVNQTPGLQERIHFGVEVERLQFDGPRPCVSLHGGEERCANRRIFVGTGLKMKDEPMLRALGGIPYEESTKERALHKRVCILGNGNSGFELAQNMFSVAERVTLYGRSPHRLSAVTRYTGDVRVKYLQALENINGKLLDTVDFFETLPVIHGEERLPLNTTQIHSLKELIRTAAWLDQFECEAFFFATGVESVVPGRSLGRNGNKDRFPETNSWHSAVENPQFHYIGWLMHGEDFQQGSGGFFSGYRYLIRNLVHHILEEDHGKEYPSKVFYTKESVVAHAVTRIQIADDLIILQDGRVLRDAIIPIKTGNVTSSWRYFEGVTFQYHPNLFEDMSDTIYLYLSWGDGKTASHVFDGVWRYSDSKKLINLFLHPVIQVGQLTRGIHEDLDMSWKDPAYVKAIETVFLDALEGNLNSFAPREDFSWKRSEINQTRASDLYQMSDLKSTIDNRVFQSLWKTLYVAGTEHEKRGQEELSAAMKLWQPRLFD